MDTTYPYIDEDAIVTDVDNSTTDDYGTSITFADHERPEEPALSFIHEPFNPPEISVATTLQLEGESRPVYTAFYLDDDQLKALRDHIDDYLEGK